jgi:hypothetical protein
MMLFSDEDVVNWLEKNSHRILFIRGKMGRLMFRYGTRDEQGHYTWKESYPTLREAVSHAIEYDEHDSK